MMIGLEDTSPSTAAVHAVRIRFSDSRLATLLLINNANAPAHAFAFLGSKVHAGRVTELDIIICMHHWVDVSSKLYNEMIRQRWLRNIKALL